MSIKIVLAAIAVFTMGTQAMTQEAARKRLLLGTELGVSVQTYTDWWGQGEKYRQSAFRFGPQLGIFLTPTLAIGLSGEYAWHQSNYLEDVYPPIYGAGGFLRYYFRIKAFDQHFGEGRVLYYAGASYHQTNRYHTRSGGLEVGSRLNEQLVFLNAGVNVRIFKQLYLEWSAKPEFYIGRGARFTGRAGFEYHFEKKSDKS